MRNPYIIVVSVLMVLSAVVSAEPATRPIVSVDQIPIPAPRGQAVAAAGPAAMPAVAPAGSKLVICPFESLGNVDRRDWVVRALQESFSTEASRLGGLFVISAPAPAGQQIDTAAARDIAKAYSGDLVIFGSCQFVDTNLRITGQIINAKTGASVAGLKAGGDLRDLFSLEDELTAQMSRALRPPSPTAVAQATNSPIFLQPAPPLTADDLYPAPDSSAVFFNAYNRYYYQPYGYYPYYGYGAYFNNGFLFTNSFPGAYPNHFRFDPHHRHDADVGRFPYVGAN